MKNDKLKELADRFDKLKTSLASSKGQLKQAVESLKTEHGIDNAVEASKVLTDYESKVAKWRKERNALMEEIDQALTTAEADESVEDDDDFEDDFDEE